MMENRGQFAAALQRLGGDGQLFQELATYFMEDAGELLEAIRLGLAAGNAQHVERAAHSLRGLAANFEAEQIVTTGMSIEQMASRGELQAVPPVLRDLEAEVQSLQGILQDYVSQAAAGNCHAGIPAVH
jgi:HPt (histidine-containing phosphotransfer) domain-containing protein